MQIIISDYTRQISKFQLEELHIVIKKLGLQDSFTACEALDMSLNLTESEPEFSFSVNGCPLVSSLGFAQIPKSVQIFI